MSKTLNEAAITTRNARAKLPIGLHFRSVDPEVHLGYRKGKRGGVWLVRWRNWGPGANYLQIALGTADDAIAEGTLDYNAAIRAARSVVEAARAEAKARGEGPPLTVRSAVETYVEGRDARDSRRKARAVRSDANRRLCRYVLGQDKRGRQAAVLAAPLAEVALHTMKEADLLTWRKGLPGTMKAATVQRLVNDLKAALNGAYAAHRDRLPATLPAAVKHGLRAIAHADDEAVPLARDNQILTDAQVGALLKAAREIDSEGGWEGDLFPLVVVLAATGARFSQVVRMKVGDVQRSVARLMVPVSRKGRGGKSGATPVPVGQDVLDILLPAVSGRLGDAPLFERWRHRQVAPKTWERVERAAWRNDSELRRPWLAIRERADLPGVIPYAFRHSSIVRGIAANLPIRLVAAMHDTSVAMIERHYAKWIVDGLDELAARAVVPLVPQDGNVTRLADHRRA